MLLVVATTPTELHRAAYEMEFREVLTLYHHTRRTERAREADDLDRQALQIRADALVRGVASERNKDALNEILQSLGDQARTLREPEFAPEPEMDESELQFLQARFKPGV